MQNCGLNNQSYIYSQYYCLVPCCFPITWFLASKNCCIRVLCTSIIFHFFYLYSLSSKKNAKSPKIIYQYYSIQALHQPASKSYNNSNEEDSRCNKMFSGRRFTFCNLCNCTVSCFEKTKSEKKPNASNQQNSSYVYKTAGVIKCFVEEHKVFVISAFIASFAVIYSLRETVQPSSF